MRVLTEYEEGGGAKQDILQADDEEETEVDATGGSDAEADASGSEGERSREWPYSRATSAMSALEPCTRLPTL
jgi:hypothetical protein